MNYTNEYVRADIAQAPAPVRVKPLVWVNGAAKDLYGDEYQVVLHEGGTYEIEHPRLFNSWHRFPTIEAAKAAAQADYEARMLAALEAPGAGVVAELVERIERYAFACEAGPLTHCQEWINLKEALGCHR